MAKKQLPPESPAPANPFVDETDLAGDTHPGKLKSVEDWNTELTPEPWQFAAAKVVAGWPGGREVTRAEFRAAIAKASGLVSR